MKNQIADASLPTTSNLNYVLSQCGIFDKYIMYDTGDYEEQAMVWKPNGDIILYTFTRTSTSGYNTRWTVDVSSGDGTYSINNPVYVYGSEEGVFVAPPKLQSANTIASMSVCVVLILSIVFPILFRKGCR